MRISKKLQFFIVTFAVAGALMFQFCKDPNYNGSAVHDFLVSGIQPYNDPKENKIAMLETTLDKVYIEKKTVERDHSKLVYETSRGMADRTYSMDTYIFRLLQEYGKKEGVPKETWYPIVMMESGGNPTSTMINSKEDSRGLFQINTKVHAIGKTQAYNPKANIEWQMPVIAKTYREAKAKGLKGFAVVCYVEKYGQRCHYTATVERTLKKYYDEITGGK